MLAAEFLENERRIALASCEEYGRKKKMQELMASKYDILYVSATNLSLLITEMERTYQSIIT